MTDKNKTNRSKKVDKTSKAGKRKLSWGARLGLWCVGIAGGLLFLSVFNVVLLRYLPVYYTPLMVKRQIEARKEDKPFTLHHQWVSFDQIDPSLTRAVMASEDNLFLKHNGFSKRGIRQAINEKIANGQVRHGGSTISQQTAKNVFTTGSRSYARKAVEAYYTFLIEKIWGKQRIMEVYLNSIEMGDGIFGAEAAAQKYFGHNASHLNAQESALIAVCLPNPRKMHADKPSSYVRKRQNQILILMPKLGPINFNTKEDTRKAEK